MRSASQKRKSVKKPLRGKALLRATFNKIVEEPWKWEQWNSSRSNYAYCFCCHLAQLAQIPMIAAESNGTRGEESVAAAARITKRQFDALYFPENTLADLRRLVVKFTGSSRGLLPLPKQEGAVR